MSAESTSVAASLVITDADCGVVPRHDHLDGWSIRLQPEGTWTFAFEREGASSVTGRRQWGTYELGEGVLRLLAQKARHYCGIGDPGDATGEGLEWAPVEPAAFRGVGAAVEIEGKTRTIHYEKAADCEDVAKAEARAKEEREAACAFGAEVSRLAGQYRHLCRPVLSEALRRAGGDAGRAAAELGPKEAAAREECEARARAKAEREQERKAEKAAKKKAEAKRKQEEKGEERVLEQFKRFDTSGEGRVGLKQLRGVLQSLVGKEVWPDTDVETLFRHFNADADGRIQYDEFLAWVFGATAECSSLLLRDGDWVEAKCKGWAKYSRGKITDFSPGEGYEILFDDGERKHGVERWRIRTQ